jgi:hypothetical protein
MWILANAMRKSVNFSHSVLDHREKTCGLVATTVKNKRGKTMSLLKTPCGF